ncbi:MAG: response regulator [Lachnospiraceae bacterium]|nr:response regulator [Lachnospiraceae bacterium]
MMKVMLVDDEPFIMQGLEVLIDWNALGYEIVKMASNGGEAYEYLKSEQVDMVISDISMPVMTGLDLLKRIREEGLSDAYFVILSGYNDFKYAQQAIRYASMDYLLKPIDREELTDILKRAARMRESEHDETGMTAVLRALRTFRSDQDIKTYGDEINVPQGRIMLLKEQLDSLIAAVEQNDITEINRSVDVLYDETRDRGMSTDVFDLNLNYLLFRLIHLAVEQDESVDQEEVLSYISDNVYESGEIRGSRTHLKRFAISYAEYLVQLRKNVSRGILQEIEHEIRANFADNLTLKDLSRKYYVNSSYLGQLFKKKYDQSFKDYLCSVRISEAASMLLKTDEKIPVIAEKVGYKDTDYFIQKFIELKGCTPAKYRRNSGLE